MQALLGDTSYNANAAANRIQDTGSGQTDQQWTTDGSAATTMLIEIAGNRIGNTFGLYNLSDRSKTLQVFAGNDAGKTVATVSFDGLGNASVDTRSALIGNQFGFYLEYNGTYYYSRNSDNSSGKDHMVTLTTATPETLLLGSSALGNWKLADGTTESWNPGEYLLGWEDLPSGDFDYNDMLIKVDATPVPEPTTVLAGALLLIPFGVSTMRMLRKRS